MLPQAGSLRPLCFATTIFLFVYYVRDICQLVAYRDYPLCTGYHDCPVFDFPYLVGVGLGRPRNDIASPPPRTLLVPNTRLRRS